MKVLMHFNGAYSNNAGVSRVVLGLGEALEEKGIGMDYLYGYNVPNGKHSYLNALNGKLHFLHHSPLTALMFARWIKGKEFDVVHSHTPEAAFDAVIARALLRKKYKLTVHLHGLDKALRTEWLKEVENGMATFSLRQELYLRVSIFKAWFAFRYAGSFIAVSHSVARQAKTLYGVDAEVAPNSVDCGKFKKIRKTKARKLLGLGEKPVVLFVGNASWVKGLKYLVEAVKEIDALLLVVGLEKDEETSLSLGEKVRFEGIVDQKKLSLYYSAADVLCVPSVYEAFGLVYAEAACFSLPCVGCKGTGAEEIIENGKNGFLVEKRNPREIRSAIKRIIFSKGGSGFGCVKQAKRRSDK